MRVIVVTLENAKVSLGILTLRARLEVAPNHPEGFCHVTYVYTFDVVIAKFEYILRESLGKVH